MRLVGDARQIFWFAKMISTGSSKPIDYDQRSREGTRAGSLMNWRFWKKPSTTVVKVVNRDRSQLRLAEWQRDASRTSLAVNVLSDPDVRLMLDVVANEHPSSNVLSDDVNPNVRLVHQARGEGYTMALSNLEALAQFRKPQEALEATFEPPEEQ